MINSSDKKTAMIAGDLKKFLEAVPDDTELFTLKGVDMGAGAATIATVLYCVDANGNREVIFTCVE